MRPEWAPRSSLSSSAGGPGSLPVSGGWRRAQERGERSAETRSGDRRVSHEGEDDPEIPGRKVHRQGFDGTRPRSAEVSARRRPQEELQAEVRGVADQEEGARRAEEGRGEGGRPV